MAYALRSFNHKWHMCLTLIILGNWSSLSVLGNNLFGLAFNPRSAEETYMSAKKLVFSRVFWTPFPCSDLDDFFTQRQEINSATAGRLLMKASFADILSAEGATEDSS